MKVGLLYQEKDWANVERYQDDKTIIQDFHLTTLFHIGSQQVIWKDGFVEKLGESDSFLEQTLRQIMMVPLLSKEEIYYRQDIMRDFNRDPSLLKELYELSTGMQKAWDATGRKNKQQQNKESLGELITKIHVVNLFLKCAEQTKEILESRKSDITSAGLTKLKQRLSEEVSDEKIQKIRKVLDDISFFVTDEEREERMKSGRICVPQIQIGCSVGENLRFDNFSLEDVKSKDKKYHKPGGMLSQMEDRKYQSLLDAVNLNKSPALQKQKDYLEKVVVTYLCDALTPFIEGFGSFIDQLRFQTAFYLGIYNLEEHLKRYDEEMCYPKVIEQNNFVFEDLKEMVMCLEQHKGPIGNSTEIKDKNLMVVTGANQGGKSTYLRSIGIAQIMMQCGMPVMASKYQSGIYPRFFTHFTRREDSEMNSGRLDEELKRMSQIVDMLGKDSIVLLNESFATTTEKEGSIIAYDIIKALTEAGVCVLMVTHLMSFAKRLYEENTEQKSQGNTEDRMVFLSAERLEDGERTFKMISSVPQLTSFGLDLYDTMVLHRKYEERE